MKKINFGVIGAGTWARAHAEIYASHPHTRLAAMCDTDENKAHELADDFGGVKTDRESVHPHHAPMRPGFQKAYAKREVNQRLP